MLEIFYLIRISLKYIFPFFFIIYLIDNCKIIDLGIFETKVDRNDYIIRDNKYYLKPSLIKKYNYFLKVCKERKLIDKTKYPLLKTPKISVIIPLYNGRHYLDYSLRTIQNQNLKELEIIIIDDCSTDDSLNYVERLMKEEKRIRLIKNYKHRKILYSKSIAALNSNGEFILELDQDDMFIREDLFEIIYKEAKSHNYDLVQFRDFIKEDFFFNRKTRINFGNFHWIPAKNVTYVKKPELKKTLFLKNNNYLLWGLLINSEIYKKAIYKILEFIINYQCIYNEDYISTTIIIMLSKNYKFLNMFGILHLKHKNETSFNFSEKKEFHLSNILFPNYLNDYIIKNNPKDIHLITNYINLNKKNQIKASGLFPKFFEFNIRNIIYNNYLKQSDRKAIFDIFNIQKNQSKLLLSYASFMNNDDFNSIVQFQNSVLNISKGNKNYLTIHTIINKTRLGINNFPYIYINNNSSSIFDINKNINLSLKNNTDKLNRSISPKISIVVYCNEI